MKAAIIIADGVKQIMFTPENDSERQALKLITPNENISVDIRKGSFYNSQPPSSAGYVVAMCKGDFLRAYDCEDSLMLVLRPKESI